MADSSMQLNWTDEQWNKVRQVVYEEARKARVAGNFLPLYGPLEPDARFVANQTLDEKQENGVDVFRVLDSTSLPLLTIQEQVRLRSAQVADPDLNSALIAFRRAANKLARGEDEIIFKGGGRAEDETPTQGMGSSRMPSLVESAKTPVDVGDKKKGAKKGAHGEVVGGLLVKAVSEAVSELEKQRHFGPFACVLGHDYFLAVQTPADSMVLPQDRILPFLGGGALIRTSVLEPREGLVIALGGAPIDLVVATDISVTFLQVTTEPFFVFRVHEKFVLRINQPEAIAHLS